MHWKDELITSTKDVDSFLTRHVSQINFRDIGRLPNVQISLNTKNKLRGNVKASYEGYIQPIIYVLLEPYNGKLCWNSLKVHHKKLEKHHLSAMIFKCGVGLAKEQGFDRIRILGVLRDGVGFWPHFGAKRTDGNNYEIDLLDDETVKIIKDRVGRIPDFKPCKKPATKPSPLLDRHNL